ncbi:hypothetical protein ETU08_03370 [Apibacter muscae]|uniref:Protein BatD n=1 Tax=Apibacter muscae TaxID=2509004 RepID=A0A563DIE3_9FLAO|nr:hypothetical protein [Apibacter muscae]TWP29907.1 hypothetical protein ETU09_02690 [Apibacter muscae]TWP31061.1 hypothetical protein ETU08_03370 [Apibacter muscae]
MRLIVVIFCFSLFSVFVNSQNPLTSSISSKKIKYGEEVVLKLEVKASKNEAIVFPEIKDTLSYHLEILENKRDTLFKEGIYTYIDSIKFSAYEPGIFTVPSQKVQINSKEYFSPEYKLIIDSMVVDSTKQPLYDIYPIVQEPKIFQDYVKQYWVYILMAFIMIVVILIVMVLYFIEIKKKKIKGDKILYPYKLALNKLNKLEKSDYLSKGLSKKYYSEMVLILKEYIEQRWKVGATQLFSEDLILYLEKNFKIKEEQKNDLKNIFQAADLAKFAKSKPTIKETVQHTQMAKKFISESNTDFLMDKDDHAY